MTSIKVEIDKNESVPSNPQVASVTVLQQPYCPFKHAYLFVLIFDLIGSASVGLLCLAGIFDTGTIWNLLMEVDQQSTTSSVKEFSPRETNLYEPPPIYGDSEVSTWFYWYTRSVFVIGLILVVMVQYIGWKGYRSHHVKSIHLYSICKGITAFASFIQVCKVASFLNFLTLFINLSFSLIPLTFAIKLSKQTP